MHDLISGIVIPSDYYHTHIGLVHTMERFLAASLRHTWDKLGGKVKGRSLKGGIMGGTCIGLEKGIQWRDESL